MRWGEIIRGIVEGAGLVRDIVRAGRSPAQEIRRIRADERRRDAEQAWREELRERWPDTEAPSTQPSARGVDDPYTGWE